jgi:hypothetical protein
VLDDLPVSMDMSPDIYYPRLGDELRKHGNDWQRLATNARDVQGS